MTIGNDLSRRDDYPATKSGFGRIGGFISDDNDDARRDFGVYGSRAKPRKGALTTISIASIRIADIGAPPPVELPLRLR